MNLMSDDFMKLIKNWKNSRNIAVKQNNTEAIRMLDMAFPYLWPYNSNLHNIESYTKIFRYYKPIKPDNGLTLQQAFELELEVYKRVSHKPNFARLLSFSHDSYELTIENCGKVLSNIPYRSLYVKDLDSQINNICHTLKANNIVHLDIQSKNICHKNGIFYLIDFDMCIIDNVPLNDTLKTLYIQQKNINLHKLLYAIIAPTIK